MRRYIRHPVDIPIEVSKAVDFGNVRGDNVSVGGLSLRCSNELEAGTIVSLKIPFVQPSFETNARVAWCTPRPEGFELGVEFLGTEDAFRARMVEQICSIESYRNAVYQRERRSLSMEEAAMEWIEKYASQFPGAVHEDGH